MHHVTKVVLGKGAERMLFSKLCLICSSLVISSCKWENLASSVLFQGKTYSLLEGSERSLRSRRLEVVGERENGCVRGSRTPVFSCAHYFQAPDTQAKVSPVFSIQYSHVNHNALYLPSPLNFAWALSLISLGTTVIPRKNWKHGLCKFWWINKVHYYVRESAEYNNWSSPSTPPGADYSATDTTK